MRIATQPVKIDGIEFDALISKKQTLSSDIPEYPIETGVTVTDTIINKALELQVTVCVSNTPVTWVHEHGVSETRVDDVLRELEDLWKERKIVTVETAFNVYENMVIQEIAFEKTVESAYSRDIPITLKQITITETETAEVPSDYEKVGETMASAGNANTKSSTGGAVGGSGSDGNNAGGSGNSQDSDWTKWLFNKSVLGGAVNSIGQWFGM